MLGISHKVGLPKSESKWCRLTYYAKKPNFDGRVGYALLPPSPSIAV
jgi:hypothetical protein